MLGWSLSSSCMDGEVEMRVATHAAVGWFAVFDHICTYVRRQKDGEGEGGGVSLSL